MEGAIRSEMSVSDRILNPSLIVFTGVLSLYIFNLVAGLAVEEFNVWLHIPLFVLQVLLSILMFTPLHDAVHKTANKNRLVNELMMHGTWIFFLNAPMVFRKIHLAHHAHTNQGEDDPDHFTSANTWLGRWLKSFLLIFSYYNYAIRKFKRTPENFFWLGSSFMVLVIAYLSLFIVDNPLQLLFVWQLPAFVGIGFLGFLNTAWPHHPGKDASRYGNTKILKVWKPLEWLLLYQNYHLVHHLRPQLPWYRYTSYWKEHQEEILAQGAEILDYRQKGC